MCEVVEAASTVLVRTDEQGRIVAIISSDFLEDTEGWLRIDEGYGIRYRHAQTQYLTGGLRDKNGCCRWKLERGHPILRSADEIAADIVDAAPEVGGGTDVDAARRIAELERQVEAQDQQIAMLLEGATEDEQ